MLHNTNDCQCKTAKWCCCAGSNGSAPDLLLRRLDSGTSVATSEASGAFERSNSLRWAMCGCRLTFSAHTIITQSVVTGRSERCRVADVLFHRF